MKYLLLLFGTLFLLSCKKDSNLLHSKSGNSGGALMMRIKNSSGQLFTASQSAGADFGVIAYGSVTEYQSFDHIVAYPGANVTINGASIHAGYLYCGTPPLPMLENGKYTLEIFPDDSYFPGFMNAKFIKDE